MKLAYYPGPVSKIPLWRGLAAAAGVEARLGGYMFGVPFPSAEDRAAAEARIEAQIAAGAPSDRREQRTQRMARFYHRARLICEGAVQRGVTHVGIWNGQGGRRRTLMLAVRQIGLKTLYAELAPIPGHITLDPQGVNAASMLSRDPDYYRAWGAAHRDSGGLEGWRGQLVARAGVKRENQGEAGSGPFVFVPLQVRTDTQIVLNGGWIKSVPQLIDEVAHAAERLPAGWRVVFREHPSDRLGNAEQLGRVVGPRVAVDNATDTFELVRRSAGVVTVNSSVGLQALLFGKPVLTLGHANYAVPGIVATASGAEPLGEAFASARDWSIDLPLAEAFLRFVAEEYYVPWPIADEVTRARVASQMHSRLAGRLTDWSQS